MASTVQHPPADPSLATLLQEIRRGMPTNGSGTVTLTQAQLLGITTIAHGRGVQAEQRRARAQQQA